MHALKPSLWMLGLLALAACSFAEKQLIGQWRVVDSNYTNYIQLHADGTFSARLEQNMFANTPVVLGTYSGTWRLKDGHLNGAVKQSTVSMLAAGYVWSDEIMELTAEKAVFRQSTGHSETWTRLQ